MSERAGRILVVDDVGENVRLLEAVLGTHGYEVVSATDGDAALELAVAGVMSTPLRGLGPDPLRSRS